MRTRHITVAVAAGLTLLAASCGGDANSIDGRPATTSAVNTSAADDTTLSTESSGTDPASASGSTTTYQEAEQDLDERADSVRDALSNGDFTTMLDLLELSGLSDELEGREVTVLAPSEEAFRELSADELSGLITDPGSAEELLRRHIIDGRYSYAELAALTEVVTISDEILTVTSDGNSITVAGATVSAPDAEVLAGEQGQEVAVFGIDRLLLDS